MLAYAPLTAHHPGRLDLVSLDPSSPAVDELGLLAPARLVFAEGGARLDAFTRTWMVRAAATGDVLYLDGGNSLDVPRLAESARRLKLPQEDILRSVRVARGFTAHQWAALLDSAAALVQRDTRLLVVSAFAEMYLDEDVGASEGRVLARRGAERLARLARAARVPVLVTARGGPLSPWIRDLLVGLADEAILVSDAGRGAAEVALLKARRTILLAGGRQRLLSEYVASHAPSPSRAPAAAAAAAAAPASVGVA